MYILKIINTWNTENFRYWDEYPMMLQCWIYATIQWLKAQLDNTRNEPDKPCTLGDYDV